MALSLAGQALVVFAIFDIAERHVSIAWLLVSLLQVSLAIIMPNFVHRVFSSFAAALAFSMVLTYRGWPYLVSGVVLFLASLCWLEEFRYPRQMRKIRAVGYGLVLALIQMKGVALFGYGILGWQFARNRPEWWAKPLIGGIMRYRVRYDAVKLATNAYFFQEDHGKYYQLGRYGQFRVDDKGELLLVALHDADLNRLGPTGS